MRVECESNKAEFYLISVNIILVFLVLLEGLLRLCGVRFSYFHMRIIKSSYLCFSIIIMSSLLFLLLTVGLVLC